MELTFTERLSPDPHANVWLTLPLTAEERSRTRQKLNAPTGAPLTLALPRGTLLRDGDLLKSPHDGRLLRITASAEAVVTVTAPEPGALLKAAYHLGNRHVAVQLGSDFIRLLPDPVLLALLVQLGMTCRHDVAPFEPEAGAYQHGH